MKFDANYAIHQHPLPQGVQIFCFFGTNLFRETSVHPLPVPSTPRRGGGLILMGSLLCDLFPFPMLFNSIIRDQFSLYSSIHLWASTDLDVCRNFFYTKNQIRIPPSAPPSPASFNKTTT